MSHDSVRRAFAVLTLLGCNRSASSSALEAGAVITNDSVAMAAPLVPPSASSDPAEIPDPLTDYTAIDAAKADGLKANGKTLLIRAWRGSTDATTVTLYGCGRLAGGYIEARYPTELRALLKALPTSIPIHDACPRVVVKIVGRQPYTNELAGEVQGILDVAPAEPETLPPGVDYVSMDDINIDGKKATGKVAQLRAYRGAVEEKKFTLYPCTHSGGLNFLYVTYTPAQANVVKALSDSLLSCQAIRVKLTSQQAQNSTWNAELIGVMKD